MTSFIRRLTRPRRPVTHAAASTRRRSHRGWQVRRGLAVLCALVATVGVVRVISPPPPPTRAVVVAAADLPVGAIVTPEDVDVVQWPAAVTGEWALGDPGTVVGRALTTPLRQGEPVSGHQVATSSLADGLPRGLQLMHVPLDDPAVTAATDPGSRVDLRARGAGVEAAEGATVSDVLVVATSSGEAPGLWLAVSRAQAGVLAGAAGPEGALPWAVSLRPR